MNRPNGSVKNGGSVLKLKFCFVKFENFASKFEKKYSNFEKKNLEILKKKPKSCTKS